MRSIPLPSSGPIHFDCRAQSAGTAIRNLNDTLLRMRPGPRVFQVRVAEPEVLDAVVGWACLGGAPHEVVEGAGGREVRIYLLPVALGGHPSGAFVRARLDRAIVQRPQAARAQASAVEPSSDQQASA